MQYKLDSSVKQFSDNQQIPSPYDRWEDKGKKKVRRIYSRTCLCAHLSNAHLHLPRRHSYPASAAQQQQALDSAVCSRPELPEMDDRLLLRISLCP